MRPWTVFSPVLVRVLTGVVMPLAAAEEAMSEAWPLISRGIAAAETAPARAKGAMIPVNFIVSVCLV